MIIYFKKNELLQTLIWSIIIDESFKFVTSKRNSEITLLDFYGIYFYNLYDLTNVYFLL